jgi:hypothetical protein
MDVSNQSLSNSNRPNDDVSYYSAVQLESCIFINANDWNAINSCIKTKTPIFGSANPAGIDYLYNMYKF